MVESRGVPGEMQQRLEDQELGLTQLQEYWTKKKKTWEDVRRCFKDRKRYSQFEHNNDLGPHPKVQHQVTGSNCRAAVGRCSYSTK